MAAAKTASTGTLVDVKAVEPTATTIKAVGPTATTIKAVEPTSTAIKAVEPTVSATKPTNVNVISLVMLYTSAPTFAKDAEQYQLWTMSNAPVQSVVACMPQVKDTDPVARTMWSVELPTPNHPFGFIEHLRILHKGECRVLRPLRHTSTGRTATQYFLMDTLHYKTCERIVVIVDTETTSQPYSGSFRERFTRILVDPMMFEPLIPLPAHYDSD